MILIVKAIAAVALFTTLVACGGTTTNTGSGLPAASGSFAFTNPTGTQPAALTFQPKFGTAMSGSGTYLFYSIHAQNVGTASASNVQVLDFTFDVTSNPGPTFDFATNPNTSLTYLEESDKGVLIDKFKAVSGTVQLDSVVGNTYTFRLTNVKLEADSTMPNTGSTVTLNGSVSVEYVFGS